MALFVAKHLSKPGSAFGPWTVFFHVYLQDNLPKGSPGSRNQAPSGIAAFQAQRPRPIRFSPRSSAQQHRTIYAAAGSPFDGRQSSHYHGTSSNAGVFRGSTLSERKDNSPSIRQSRRPVRTFQSAGTPKVNRVVVPLPADMAKRNGQTIRQRPEGNLLRMDAMEGLRFPEHRPVGRQRPAPCPVETIFNPNEVDRFDLATSGADRVSSQA